jgi:hypothetical protein
MGLYAITSKAIPALTPRAPVNLIVWMEASLPIVLAPASQAATPRAHFDSVTPPKAPCQTPCAVASHAQVGIAWLDLHNMLPWALLSTCSARCWRLLLAAAAAALFWGSSHCLSAPYRSCVVTATAATSSNRCQAELQAPTTRK